MGVGGKGGGGGYKSPSRGDGRGDILRLGSVGVNILAVRLCYHFATQSKLGK